MSKIAVVAIVAILAAPILVGYGMNFQTDTENRYERDGSAVSVTNLLSNGMVYSYTNANVNNLNFDNIHYNTSQYRTLPNYVAYTTTKSSIQLTAGPLASSDNLNNIYYMKIDNTAAGNDSTLGLTVTVSDDDRLYAFTKVTSIYYNKNAGKVWITYNGNYNSVIDNPVSFSYTNYSGITAYWSSSASMISPSATYVDLSKGWTFPASSVNGMLDGYSGYKTPAKAQNMVLSFNIDTATSDNMFIHPYSDADSIKGKRGIYIHKETENGQDNWYVQQQTGTGLLDSDVIKLPYNNDLNNNSYQLKITRTGMDIRYIGGWNDTIGEANYYWSHKFTYPEETRISNDQHLEGFLTRTSINDPVFRSYYMVFRVDSASVLANAFNGITDATYDPANQTNKTNPVTVFDNIIKYGTYIQFGGNTYQVKDGKITIQGHDVPVDKLSFSSTLREDGLYDNEIGNTFISTTAAPSTIFYGGSWFAGISTYAQVQKEYKITHWESGKFAWAGIDTNFLLVGLMASVASFVALAMYGRRSGTKVLPLLLVCGGAALVFILMM